LFVSVVWKRAGNEQFVVFSMIVCIKTNNAYIECLYNNAVDVYIIYIEVVVSQGSEKAFLPQRI
jgi:hypothetical protein